MTEIAASVTPSASVPAATVRRLPVTLIRSIVFRFGAFGLNAVTGILTARALNPAGRGEFAALVLWPVFLAGVTTMGVPSALIYHTRSTPSQSSALLGVALLLSVVSGVAATAIGWYLVPLWLGQHPVEIRRAAQYCLLTTVVSSLTLTGRAAWEARGQFTLSNLSQVIVPLAIVLALVPQVMLGSLTPQSAAATYLLIGVPVVIWNLISLFQHDPPTLRGARELWSRLLHYGCRSYGVDLSAMLNLYLGQALVVGLLAPKAMGIYVVALSLSRTLNAVHGSLGSIMFPKVIGLERRELVEAIARSTRLGMIVAGTIGLAITIAGPTLVTWLYGAAYQPAGRVLPILVCEVILAGAVYVLLQGLLAAGRPGVATVVQLSGVGFSIPLFLWMVPAWGTHGAALALLASTVIRLLLAMLAYRQSLDMPMPRVWIGFNDLVDLAMYRWAVVNAVTRGRAGGAK